MVRAMVMNDKRQNLTDSLQGSSIVSFSVLIAQSLAKSSHDWKSIWFSFVLMPIVSLAISGLLDLPATGQIVSASWIAESFHFTWAEIANRDQPTAPRSDQFSWSSFRVTRWRYLLQSRAWSAAGLVSLVIRVVWFTHNWLPLLCGIQRNSSIRGGIN